MQFEDTTQIDTPEGLRLELTLAGIGSRFIAQIFDIVVKTVVAVAIVLVVGGGTDDMMAFTGLVSVVGFIALFVYDIAFETLWSGRTIGKRIAGIRVVDVDGAPIGFFGSTVRNLLRVVDLLPPPYVTGVISILVTKRNQRVGDLAAGALVIRDRVHTPSPAVRELEAAAIPAGFDVTAVDEEHLALARSYLQRRADLDPPVRARLADQVGTILRPLVGPTGEGLSDDRLIEYVVAAKSRTR